jgi:hypothetical protein
MAGLRRLKPVPALKLRPVQRRDGTWYVKAIRPNFPSERIGDFRSDAVAQDWIDRKARDFFAAKGWSATEGSSPQNAPSSG